MLNTEWTGRKLLNKYVNGNYTVKIYSDGTKIKTTEEDIFKSAFPESIDMKITNYCAMGCPMCHEKSTIDGKHADIMNFKFIETLTAGTEIAIGGGMVTSHPDLEAFLIKLKGLGIIANATFHQSEFEREIEFIDSLIKRKLIHGIGISFSETSLDLLYALEKYPNAVVHMINGIHSAADFGYLKNNGVKILILGYKDFGRGEDLLKDAFNLNAIVGNQYFLATSIMAILPSFKVVSFDNLAISQLRIKDKISAEKWDKFYQGDDGTHTMYIDLVENQYGRNSISTTRYTIDDTIISMFNTILAEGNN